MNDKMYLFALVSIDGKVEEETVLCSNCFSESNKEFHELSYNQDHAWLKFDPAKEVVRNQKIAQNPDCGKTPRNLTCESCGFPIDRNVITGEYKEE